MANYNYHEAVLADVREWLEDHFDELPPRFEDRDEMIQYLNDEMWTADSVTGNASGSYTFCTATAKEYVLSDPDTVKEAFEEFDEESRFADLFFSDEWETMDVIARCYCLVGAISEAVDELPDHLFETEAAERYCVIDRPREGSGDYFTEWFSDEYDARFSAEDAWHHLTDAERKKRIIEVLHAVNYDPEAVDHYDGDIIWNADEDYTEI